MNKTYFYELLEHLEIVAVNQCAKNNSMIKCFVDEARELAKYGELRIALENLLENIIEIKVEFSDELLDMSINAFGENISEYDKKLLNIIIQNKS